MGLPFWAASGPSPGVRGVKRRATKYCHLWCVPNRMPGTFPSGSRRRPSDLFQLPAVPAFDLQRIFRTWDKVRSISWLIFIDYYLRYRICWDWRGACEDIWQCSRRRRPPQYAKQFAPRPEIDPTVIWPSTLISENNFCFCYVGGVDGTSLVVQNPQKFNVPTSGGRVKGDLHFGSESGFHLDIAVHIEQLFSHVHVAYFHGDVQR